VSDINKTIERVDAREKISGIAKYVDDLKMEGEIYAKTIRATIAKGKITDISVPPLPEGYATVGVKDIPGKNFVKIIFDDQPVFTESEVTYFGEPIMLLVGPDKAVLRKIANEIRIAYKEEKPNLEWDDPMISYHFSKGDGDQPFQTASKTFSDVYITGYQEQAYLETQGLIGYPEGNRIVITGSMQCPYYIKNALINCLGCKDDMVRVIQQTVGGAFGGKEEFPSLMACQLAVAVYKMKKPVRLIYDRKEDMPVTTKRHPSRIRMEAAINKKNEITAIRAAVGLDGGANAGLSGVVLQRAMIASSGAYTFPNMDVTGRVYRTNTVPNGAFRGFGAPQMLFSIEMFIGHVAKFLGLDPFEFRMKYLAKQGDKTSTSGTFRDPIIMPELIGKAMKESDYLRKAQIYSAGNGYQGIGMSFFLHGCGFTGSGEATHIKARVRLEKDENDNVRILIAAVDMGQGIRTTMRKLVASILEIPMEKVIFDLPDTDFVPDSGPTVASRTMMIVGGLVDRCARKLKEKWLANEKQILEENFQQPEYVKWDEEKLAGDAYPAYSWGVNIVEVEIDKATCQVKPIGIWSEYDLGHAIDEMVIKGQCDGGIAQGVAYGYLEVMEQKDGRLRQKNLTDYIIPTAVDMPPTMSGVIDNPFALGPYGAKGAGELTLVGGAPAIAKAIEMAIKRNVTEIPVTPEKIRELIDNGRN